MHGDLFRDNVLFNEWGLTGVLDFHHAARGVLIYDLAVAANDWCTDSTGLMNPDRATTLLRAYHRIRPLSRSEIRLFPTFALYGALAFWLSRLAVSIERERGAQRAHQQSPGVRAHSGSPPCALLLSRRARARHLTAP